MATVTKQWGNGDPLTLVTSAGGIAVTSAENLTGADREMTIRVQTTNQGTKAFQDVLIKQSKYAVLQDGYWVHKDTGVKTYFGLEDSSIENGIMGYPSWMPNCSEVKLPSGVTGFKTYNWVIEEWDNMEVTYIGFVHSKETLLTGNDILIGVDLSNTDVPSLGDGCFFNCTALTSITLPDSVTSLGDSCFEECTSLTSITLPESVTSLGGYCFTMCESLTSITIPESVTILGQACFAGCTSLILATVLPAIPPSIGSYVFDDVHPSLSIKVPSSSVNAYKAATNWKNYASIISAI